MYSMNISLPPRNHCHYYSLKQFHSRFLPLYGHIGTFICIISVLTNFTTVVVLTNKRMKTPTNTILLSLASLDIIICLVLLPVLIQFYIINIETLMHHHPWYKEWTWVFYYLICTNLSLVAHTSSMWLGAALAVFRYYIIKSCTSLSNMKFRVKEHQRCAKFIILGSLACNSLLIIPYLLTQTIYIKTQSQNTLNGTQNYVLYQASRYSDTPYLDFYSFWMISLLGKIIPSLIMLIFMVALLHSMGENEGRRQSLILLKVLQRGVNSKLRQNDHHRATRFLVVIVVIILVAEVPHAVMQFLSRIEKTSYCIYIYLGDLMDILTLCKNSVTFILYCLMSSDFRKIFTYYYMPCRCVSNSIPRWSKDDLEQQSSVIDNCSVIPLHFRSIPIFIKEDSFISTKLIRTKSINPNVHL